MRAVFGMRHDLTVSSHVFSLSFLCMGELREALRYVQQCCIHCREGIWVFGWWLYLSCAARAAVHAELFLHMPIKEERQRHHFGCAVSATQER